MKSKRIKRERQRLAVLFKKVDNGKKELVEKLLDQAAFIAIENEDLEAIMQETGMIKVHPQNKSIQKQVPAAKEYRQNVNSYAVIIKTLNGILTKDGQEEDDPFDEFLKQKLSERQSKQ